MKRWVFVLAAAWVPLAYALDVPKAEKLGDPAFVKGFDSFSRKVKTPAGSPLFSLAEATKFVNDLLLIARRGAGLSPELVQSLETTAAVFAGNPYSLTAGFAFQQAFGAVFVAQQLSLAIPPVRQEPSDDVFRKMAYLNGMRLRLAEHLDGLARAVDWEHARAGYPGGPKKFDRAVKP